LNRVISALYNKVIARAGFMAAGVRQVTGVILPDCWQTSLARVATAKKSFEMAGDVDVHVFMHRGPIGLKRAFCGRF
jgi:hypothetical protein